MSGAPVLSDMDGVLVDSGAAVERVWRRWAARHGLAFAEIAALVHGRPSREAVAAVLPGADLAAESAWVEDEQTRDTAGVVAVRGAARLLARRAPLAVVTSASERLAASRLAAAGLARPAHVVTVEMIERGKPDPEAYLLGARLLGVAPAACVVLEDAPAGVAAGRAAGMRVVGLATTHTSAELAGADVVVADLVGIEAVLRSLGG
jgi:sugar-phosphatase